MTRARLAQLRPFLLSLFPLVLPALSVACAGPTDVSDAGDADGGEGGSELVVTLTGDGATLTDASRVHVLLLGFDPSIADQSANPIARATSTVSALPSDLVLSVPANPEALIEPGDPAAEDARYYFAIHIDVDDDGQICAGDFQQAFGSDGPTIARLADLANLSIPVELKTADNCSPIP